MPEQMLGMLYYGKPIKGHAHLDAGDDALPYVGNRLISVADGVGGSAGGAQTHINDQLLHPGASFDAATRGCLGKHADKYREQYMESFRFLFEAGRDYRSICPRKSSYFGSRLTTIFMRRQLEDKIFDSREDFEGWMHALHHADPEEQRVMLTEMEDHLADKLADFLHKAADNCGMPAHAVNSNVSHMGTTYSGILYLEDEDCVHAVSIQAGDSLCLAFVPQKNPNGQPMLSLRLLLPPQENENDGVMSNCITANKHFHFACAYHCLPKPCIIITTSDGCFDTFPSMRWFEQFLLTHLGNEHHRMLEDAMESMRSYFATGVSMDDSSTMAAAAFGFQAYEQLRRMACTRQDELEARYGMHTGQQDAALTPDEEAQLEENRVQRQIEQNKLLKARAEECWRGSAWLRSTVLARLEEPVHKAKVDALLQREASRSGGITRELDEQRAELSRMVRRYWLDLRMRSSQSRQPFFGGFSPDALAEELAEKSRARDRIQREFDRLHADSAKCAARMADHCMEYAMPENASAQEMARCHDEAMRKLGDQLDLLCAAGEQMIQCRHTLAGLKTDIDRAFPLLLQADAGQIDAVTEELLSSRQPQGFYRLSDEVRQQFGALIRRINELRTERRELSETIVPRIREEYALRLFLGRPVLLCLECVTQHADTLPEGLRAELQAALAEIDERFPTTTEKSRQESRADAEYDRELNQIMVQKV